MDALTVDVGAQLDLNSKGVSRPEWQMTIG